MFLNYEQLRAEFENWWTGKWVKFEEYLDAEEHYGYDGFMGTKIEWIPDNFNGKLVPKENFTYVAWRAWIAKHRIDKGEIK